jgi:hypothetical protein
VTVSGVVKLYKAAVTPLDWPNVFPIYSLITTENIKVQLKNDCLKQTRFPNNDCLVMIYKPITWKGSYSL